MKKFYEYEVGKSYTLKNGTVITVTDIGRRSYDRSLLVSYRTADGQLGDSTPNSLDHSINW